MYTTVFMKNTGFRQLKCSGHYLFAEFLVLVFLGLLHPEEQFPEKPKQPIKLECYVVVIKIILNSKTIFNY